MRAAEHRHFLEYFLEYLLQHTLARALGGELGGELGGDLGRALCWELGGELSEALAKDLGLQSGRLRAAPLQERGPQTQGEDGLLGQAVRWVMRRGASCLEVQ